MFCLKYFKALKTQMKYNNILERFLKSFLNFLVYKHLGIDSFIFYIVPIISIVKYSKYHTSKIYLG